MDARSSYWITRFVILRMLAIVYAVAFLVAVNEIVPLIGAQGLTPVGLYLDAARSQLGSTAAGFWALPSLFWLGHSDTALKACAWVGLALSCIAAAGYANAILMAVLWVLYMSIVHVGQVWYGYGWEIQLLETGFLAIFLCPLLDGRPFPRRDPPFIVIVLFRWLIFRIMTGAGLIKLRGDPAWRDFTALAYHFETQPIPNALSRWFHFLPRLALKIGVGFNHVAELLAPWFIFWPRIGRLVAGCILLALQLILILSGNLSFLNWLTIVPILACFDDAAWSRVMPQRLVRRALSAQATAAPSRPMRIASYGLAALVGSFSVQPVVNLVSPRQVMNTSFDPFDIVNTYGAFGTVGRERLNVIFEGTEDDTPGDQSVWRPYPYRGLPVDEFTRPPQIAPYQLRLDWQMWFASMAQPDDYPFTINVVWKLLHGDQGTLSLFAANPFPGKAPKYVRATIYRYKFADPKNPEGRWWTREVVGTWLPPMSVDTPQLQRYVAAMGWK